MVRISAAALDWLDQIGWCECQPTKDKCAVCRQKRDSMRVQQPQVYRGAVQKARRLDWEP